MSSRKRKGTKSLQQQYFKSLERWYLNSRSFALIGGRILPLPQEGNVNSMQLRPTALWFAGSTVPSVCTLHSSHRSISIAFKPLLFLRELIKLTQGLKTEAGLKQFVKSKQELEFLGLCLQYFI